MRRRAGGFWWRRLRGCLRVEDKLPCLISHRAEKGLHGLVVIYGSRYHNDKDGGYAKRTSSQKATAPRAFGRSLSDFGKLNDAEKNLIAATRKGEFANFGENVPQKREMKSRTIRGGLVRFLALGGDDIVPVHEQGVRVQGAVIDGEINFRSCNLGGDLLLFDCALTGTLSLFGAHTRTINLSGSHCQDIAADRVEISGGLYLRNEFVAQGAVRLIGAEIRQELDCSRGRFKGRNYDGDALSCDGIKVGGHVFLNDIQITGGAISLLGAKITGNLQCGGSKFEGQNKDEYSLTWDRVHVGGDVSFARGFAAKGAVIMRGAMVDGDVICAGGCFGATPESGADAAQRKSDAYTSIPVKLALTRTTVKGRLWLGGEQAKFHGGVDLTGARIGWLVDTVTDITKHRTPDSPQAGAGNNPSFLVLDGLTYEGFGAITDLTAPARIAFLHLQRPIDLGKGFKPQPWTQMIKVLRDTGHEETARDIAIAYEDQRRKSGTISNATARFFHWLAAATVGYGHRPTRLFKIAFGVWLFSGIVFHVAANRGWMAPTQPAYFQNDRYKGCRPENGGNWTKCDKFAASEYTSFQPYLYSLDLILPIIDLQQEKDWAPIIDWGTANVTAVNRSFNIGMFARWVMWFEIIFGWGASVFLAAVLTGLAKRVD